MGQRYASTHVCPISSKTNNLYVKELVILNSTFSLTEYHKKNSCQYDGKQLLTFNSHGKNCSRKAFSSLLRPLNRRMYKKS